MSWVRSMLVGLVFLLSCLGVAAASETGKSEFEQGRKLFLEGRFEEAQSPLETAVQRSGRRPSTIRALAQNERARGNKRRAIELFREYEKTNPPDAKQVRKTIDQLEKEVSLEAAPLPDLSPSSQSEEAPAAMELATEWSLGEVAAPEPEPSFPWIWISAALVVAGGGIALGIILASPDPIEPSGGTLNRVLHR